jgi:hypothetical protein
MTIERWVSWAEGVDLVAATNPRSTRPNIMVRAARIVHTPVGSAPCGMIVFQPTFSQPPLLMGFISTDIQIGNYFATSIFADTPFASSPTLAAKIVIDTTHLPNSVSAHILVDGHEIETEFSNLGNLTSIDRVAGSPQPFAQQGLESAAKNVSLKIDGESIDLHLLPMSMTGSAAAVWSPAGIYTR